MNSLYRSHSMPISGSSNLAHDQINIDDLIECSAIGNFWCQSCTMPHTDCICNFHTSSYQQYSAPTQTSNNIGINDHDYTSSPRLFIPSGESTYCRTPSEASSTTSYSVPATYSVTPSPISPAIPFSAPTTQAPADPPPKKSEYLPIAPAQKLVGTGANNTYQFASSSKRGKSKGFMSPEEAHEKRLQQNRRSQRSFRYRQAQLVEDLKLKVEELTEENRKLVREMKKLGVREGGGEE